MKERAVTADLLDVMPDSVRDEASKITKGAYLFDACGGRHEVGHVRRLKNGQVRITRVNGWVDTFKADELITFVPYDGRETRPAWELHEGATVLFGRFKMGPDRREVDRVTRRPSGASLMVFWKGEGCQIFERGEPVTFIPAPSRRPVVGRGATGQLHGARTGYVVVSVSEHGAQCRVAALPDPSELPGTSCPVGYRNGRFTHDYTYGAEVLAATLAEAGERTMSVRRCKDGRWRSGATEFTFDGARHFFESAN